MFPNKWANKKIDTFHNHNLTLWLVYFIWVCNIATLLHHVTLLNTSLPRSLHVLPSVLGHSAVERPSEELAGLHVPLDGRNGLEAREEVLQIGVIVEDVTPHDAEGVQVVVKCKVCHGQLAAWEPSSGAQEIGQLFGVILTLSLQNGLLFLLFNGFL